MSELENIKAGAGYVSSKTASAAYGVTNDYIARLCRTGKIKGVMEGRAWLVDTKSLGEFFGREMVGQPEAPLKIYYKDTPTIATQRIASTQVSANPAILAMFPVAAQTHVGLFGYHKQSVAIVFRGAILAVLFMAVGALGTGSYLNHGASVAVRPSVVAAASESGLFGGVGSVARAVARTIDNVVYNLFYSNDQMSQVVIVHADRTPTSTPVAVAQPVTTKIVSAQPVAQTIINNPVVERIVERRVVASAPGITEAFLNQNMDALETKLRSLIIASSGSAASQAAPIYNMIAQTNRIDTLGDVDISYSRISHSTITDSTFVNSTFSGTTNLGSLALGDATTTSNNGFDISEGCYAVNGVCITGSGGGTPGGSNGQVQFNDGGAFAGSAAFLFSTSSLRLTVTNASTTNLSINGTIDGAGLTSCSGSLDKIQYNSATGQFVCATDQTGGGGGSDTNWSFFNNSGLRPATTTNQVLIGALATSSSSKLQVIGGAQFDSATSSVINTNLLGIGGTSYFLSLTGNGLTNVAGTLTVDQGQAFSTSSVAYWDSTQARWATTSSDYWKSQTNFYSTSSADFWKTQNNFFSTTSASAFLALNQGNAFSTSSADFWKTQNNFHSTSSFAFNLSTYDTGSFFSTTSVNYWESTQNRWATTSALYFLSQNQGLAFSTSSASFFTSAGLAYSTTSANFYSSVGLAFSTTSASYFLSQNQGNAFSTSSFAYDLSTYDKGYFFSTTSVAFWDSTQSRWATTSATYFLSQNQGLAFSTTSAAAHLNTIDKGYFFSTTSAAYYASQNVTPSFSTSSASYFSSVGLAFSTTSSDYWKSQNNFHSTSSFAFNLSTYDAGSFFSTTSVAYWDSTQFRWATTSSDYWLTQRNFFSTSSAAAFLALNQGNAFSTTSASFFSSLGLAFSTSSANFYSSVGLAFSTTSASYFLGQNQGAAFSTSSAIAHLNTIDKGYFFSTTSAAYYASQNVTPSFSTSSALYFSSVGLAFSTTSTDYWKSVNNFFSTTSASHFSSLGLAFSTSSAAAFLNANQGNAFSTTSAAYNLSTYDKGYFFSTTSVAYWDSTQFRWATTSSDYWATQRNFFSTTSASAFLAVNQGNAFSTTSASFFASTGLAFSTTSANFYSSVGLAFSTTSASYFLGQNQGNAFSSTSASYFLSQNVGNAFSTTSANYASNIWANGSTTLPKTYSNNVFTGTNSFAGISATFASTTAISASGSAYFGTASTTNLLATNATSSYLYVANTIEGAGLTSCSAAGDKLIWNSTTRQFGCGADAGAGGGITALGAQYSSFQSGSSQTFATSSDTNLALTITSSGNVHTFAPSWVGTLAATRGGTGLSTITQNSLLIGGAGNTWSQVATSALGINTDNLVEGANQFYTNGRVQTYLNGVDKGFFFSTTSASNFLSQNTGNAFSTTSALFFSSVGLAHSTTSVAYQLSRPVLLGAATTTNLAITGVTNTLLKTNSSGAVVPAILGTDYLQSAITAIGPLNQWQTGSAITIATSTTVANGVTSRVTIDGTGDVLTFTPSLTGILAVSGGGTGWANIQSGTVLLGNGAGAIATTTRGNLTETGSSILTITGGSNAVLGTGASIQVAQAGASTNGFLTSSDWNSFNGRLSTTTLLTIDKGQFFSTTSSSYFASVGLSFSTTSADYYKSQNNFFSTSSASYFSSLGLAFSTSSSDYWQSQRNFFSTTSSNYYTTVGLSFSTTSAAAHLNTIDKGYFFSTTSASNFLGQNTGNAFSTTSALYFSSTGLAHSTTSVAYQLTQTPVLTNGFLAFASSTIGNGTQSGGLTINGGATTTGNLLVSGNARVNTGLLLANVISCTGSQALQTDGSGNVSCGSIATGGNSTAGGWTTNNLGRVSLSTTTDLVVVGASTTPYAKLSILSGSAATTTLALAAASGQTANILDIYGGSGSLMTVLTANGSLGLGTTSPYRALSVVGTTTATGGFNVDGNTNLLSYLGSTTLSVAGTRNISLGLGANGSTTKTFATDSVFIGDSAGYGATGNNSVYIGTLSGFGSSTGATNSGIRNTAVGYATLQINTTGGTNSAFGYNALSKNDTGGANAAFGSGSMVNNLSGANNSALGASSLQNNTTGNFNVSLGGVSMSSNTTGSANVAVGYGALLGGNGNANTVVGYNNGRNMTGYDNVLVGSVSTLTGALTSGSGNIGLGSNTFFASATGNSQLNIGGLIFGSLPATTSVWSLPTSGTVGIGTTSPTSKFGIAANNGDTLQTLFQISSSTANSTTTLFAISNTGTTTIANGVNITSGCYAISGSCIQLFNGTAASSTLLSDRNTWSALQTFNGASSTVLSVSGTLFANTASTTNLTIAGIQNAVLATDATGNVIASSSLSISNLTVINNTNFNGKTTFALASTTQISIFDKAYFGGTSTTTIDSTGTILVPTTAKLGLGTSTPWAKLSINANTSDTNPLLFAVSSTTVGNDSVPLFQISSTGNVLIGSNIASSSLIASTTGQLSVLPGTTTIKRISTVTADAPYAVYVVGRYAYVGGGSTFSVFDVSNPASPVQVGTNSNGVSAARGVYVQGRYAYVVNQLSETISVFDVSNPAAPAFISSTASGITAPQSVYVQGRYAYIGSYNGRLVIFDVSNPASMTLVSSISTGGVAYSVFVQGRYAYVGTWGSDTLKTIDVSNPALPVQVSSISTGLNQVRSVYVQGRYAYVASYGNNSFVIFDISNPSSPSFVSTISSGLSGPVSVHVQGRYAYVSNNLNNQLVTFDVSNPTYPVQISAISTSNGPWTVYVQGRYAYLGHISTNALSVYDLGGAYVSQFETGGLETGTLSVRNNIQAMDASLWGSLSIGSSLSVGGGASFTYSSTTAFGTGQSIFSINHATSSTAQGASTTPIFTALANGNVGFGTSTPVSNVTIQNNYGSTNTSLFQVSSSTSANGWTNTALFSIGNTGSTTAANGFNITAGCYAVNGVCLSSGSSASSTLLTDSNTFSALTRFTNGVMAFASSTIGNGSAAGGLTVYGGATTTGNQYVAGSISNGNITISGQTISSVGDLSISSGQATVFKNTATGINPNACNSVNCVAIGSTAILGFNSASAITTGGVDAGFSRIAPNTVGLGNGAVGDITGTLSLGRIGIGTSSPYALLSVVATSTSGIGSPTTLFVIASSTSNSTTTLFSVNNIGQINLNTFTSTSTVATFAGRSFIVASTSGFQKGGNLGVGPASLTNLTRGYYNTALGEQAMQYASTSNNSVGVGFRALQNDFAAWGLSGQGGDDNTAVGSNALYVTSGNRNTALGSSAMSGVYTGSNNVAVGYMALLGGGTVSTGSSNIGIGSNAVGAGFDILGSSNIGIGRNAMGFEQMRGSGNVALGELAGSEIARGSYNTFLGYDAGASTGFAQINGSNNIAIGPSSYLASSTQSNQLNIGNILFGTIPATSTAFTLPTSGTIGIGTTSPTSKFGIAANNGDTLLTLFQISSSTSNSTTTLFSIGNTGSTTAANGFNITAGCYAVNGVCLSSGGSASSTLLTDTNTFSALTRFTNGVMAFASSTIGNGSQAGGLTISGGATTTGNAFFANTVSIGTTSNVVALSVVSNSAGNTVAALQNSNIAGYSAISFVDQTGLAQASFGYANAGAALAPSTLFFDTNAKDFILSNSGVAANPNLVMSGLTGYIGIGTSTPYARLSVVGNVVADSYFATSTTATSTFAGGLNVGNGAITYDYSSGITSIQNLALGNMSFDADSGIISWTDMPITSATPNGTVHSYSANIDGSALITAYSESDGLGGVQRTAVGIGSTTPWARLAVDTSNLSSSTFAFVVGSSSRNFLTISNTGNGTTTVSGLAISGTATSTSNAGFNIASGCYAVNGVCLSSGSSASSTLLGADFNTFTNRVQFTGGLLSLASSTIGNGTATGGLTISGGATTTGNVYFGGLVGVGTTSPYNALSVTGTTTADGGFNVNGNRSLLSFGGSTTISVVGTANFFAGLGANGSTTKTNGSANVAIGDNAGYSLTGNQNVYIGSQAGQGGNVGAPNSGSSNIGIGSRTLQLNSTGVSNVALGVNSLQNNTTGSGNLALGTGVVTSFVLGNNTTGSNNMAFGNASMASNISGSNNVAFGYETLMFNTVGTNNTAIGFQAGNSVTGYSNTLIGDVTGGFPTTITSGSGNIGLGSNIFFSSTTANRQINIGNIIFGTVPATSTVFQLPTSGTIGIGTTSPFSKFGIALNNGETLTNAFIISSSTASATSTLFVVDRTGDVGVGTTTPYTSLSVVGTTSATGIFNIDNASGLLLSYLGSTTISTIGSNFFAGVGANGSSTKANGTNNVFVGNVAGYYASGNQNTYVGHEAGFGSPITPTASANTAVGYQALRVNAGGINNSALGAGALPANTTGQANTAIGAGAANANTSGSFNTALGYTALNSGSTASANTAIGYSTLASISSGTGNVALGFRAGTGVNQGYDNVLIGSNPQGLFQLTTGSGNIGLGAATFFPSTAGNRQLNIGNLIFGSLPATSTAGTFVLPTTGTVGIGTTSPTSKFGVALNNGDALTTAFQISSSTATATTTLFMVDNTGSTTVTGILNVGGTGTSTIGAGVNVGALNITGSATTTASRGFNIASGCYAVNGVCLSSGSSASSTLLGSDFNTFTNRVQFTGGLLSFASTTIGDGTQSGGLTVSGGATTTGNIVVRGTGTSTFAGNLTLGGTSVFASNNSFAGGNNNGQTQPITASGNGALAFGNTAFGSTGIFATGNGSVALGNAGTSGGNITASGNGSIAMGQGDVRATNAGAIALGNGPINTGGQILSSGIGSFAGGYSSMNSVVASGNASFAFGDNVVSSALNSISFGTGFANSQPNTFQVGFKPLTGAGTPSGIPTLTVNATSTGIGTTSPFALLALSANDRVTYPGNNLFLISSSTNNSTSTLFSIDNLGIVNLNSFSGTTSVAKFRGSSFIVSDGDDNLGLGVGALASSSNSIGSIGIGRDALRNDEQGSNVAIGNGALTFNTSGNGNQAIGENVMRGNISGTENVAIGVASLYSATSSSGNIAIGNSALSSFKSKTNYTYNTAIGYYAMAGNSYGVQNTVLGALSAQNLTGSGNTTFGYRAAVNANGVSNSVILGANAGSTLNTGDGNILIGASVNASNLSDGAGNIGIANNVFFPQAAGNNQLNIGNLIFGTLPATSTAFRLPTSGTFGIGTTSPTSKFGIAANSGDSLQTLFQVSSSTASATTTLFSISNTGVVAIGTSSPSTPFGGVLASQGPIFVGGASTTATSTFTGNVLVLGNLKVGASSVYISESGINFTGTSNFSLGGGTGNALSVSSTGFGTTTLTGLNVNGSATSTSNVGFNITSGCYAVNGTCLTSGADGTFSTSSALFFSSLGLAHSTTSVAYQLAQNPAFTNGLNASSTSLLGNTVVYNALTVATTSVRGSLTAQASSTYTGANLVTNGTFTGNAAGWTLGSDATYNSNNVRVYCTSSCNDPSISQSISTVSGQTYLVEFDFTGAATSGVDVYFSNNTYQSPELRKGKNTFAFTADFTGSDTFTIDSDSYGEGSLYTIDNVSVRAVTFTPSVRTYALDGTSLLDLGDGLKNNIAVGYEALSANGGRDNLALGRSALATNTGNNNIAIGIDSMYSNQLGAGNVAIGNSTLFANTSGYSNIAIGNSVLGSNTTGASNTAVGDGALDSNTTGSTGTAFGSSALSSNTSGSQNAAFGSSALNFNTTGTRNTAVGTEALLQNTTGNFNTAVGYDALKSTSAGGSNVGLGYNAGSLVFGYGNIMLGTSEASDFTHQIQNGNGNIALATNPYFESTGVNNQLNIGNILLGTLPATTSAYKIPVNGTIGIGTTSPTSRFGIALNNGGTLTTAFQISSSTGNSTTTLFSIGNTGSTTAANGFNITAGCYAVNGSCLSVGGSSASSTLLSDINTFGALTTFTSGIRASASSTIGNGSATGGLTIAGGATTTGNAYFAGNIAMGTTSPFAGLSVVAASTSAQIALYGGASYLGGGAINVIGGDGLGSTGGTVTVSGGQSSITGGNGGALNLFGGAAGQFAVGGNVNITAGSTVANGTGGNVVINPGLGQVYGNVALATTGGKVGVGTTSPFAKLSVSANGGDTNTMLFQIASTSAFGTFNQLSVNNIGQVVIGGNASSTIGQFSVMPSTTTAAKIATATNGLSNATDVAIQGRYAYVSDSGNGSMIVYDISDPVAPVRLSSTVINSSATPASIAVQGRYVYVVDGNGTTNLFTVIDVANPAAPVIVFNKTITGMGGTKQIVIQGHYAYVIGTIGSAWLLAVDISNPAAPVRVGGISSITNPNDIYVSGNYAYVVGNGTLGIFNISNPANLSLIGSYPGLTIPIGVFVQGRYAYVTNQSSGAMNVLDVSNPTAIAMVSTSTAGLSWSGPLFVQDRYAYIADENNGALVTYDVSNPASPLLVGQATGVTFPNGMQVVGRYAYIADTSSGMRVFDLGGAYVQQLEAGGIEAGMLSVRNGVQAMDGSFWGSLSVGQSLNVLGSGNFLSTYASSTNVASGPVALTAVNVDSSTTSITDVLSISHVSTSSSAAGIGTGLLFNSSTFCSLANCAGATTTATSTGRIASIFTNVSTTSMATAITFSTRSSVTGLTEWMRLTSNGRLGIGTTSPLAKLSIALNNGEMSTYAFLIASSTQNGTSTLFAIDNTGLISMMGTTTMFVSTSSRSTYFGAGTYSSTTKALPSDSVFMGNFAGNAVTGSNSVYIGSFSGAGTSTGAANSGTANNAVGYRALQVNTTGQSNSAFGSLALSQNMTGANNSAYGASALANNTTGSRNAAFGGIDVLGTMAANTTGSNNSAFGSEALSSNTSGNNNSAFGFHAGLSITTGFSNLLLGDNTTFGTTITSGGGNIGIGSNVFFPSATANNQFNIGNLLFGTLPATSTAFTLPSSGALGIGTTSPMARFTISLNNGGTQQTAFLIASSTNNSTTTFFSINNKGQVAIGAATSTAINYIGQLSVTPGTTTMSLASVTAVSTFQKNVFVQGRYAYLSGSSGFQIYDVSNVSSPVLLSTISMTGYGVYVQGKYAYVADRNGPYLVIVDVSNPNAPFVTGRAVMNGDIFELWVQGQFAYTVNFSGGQMQIVDVSNPSAPRVVSSVSTASNSKDVSVQGKYAYVAGGLGNLSVVDVSNPATPAKVGSVSITNPGEIYVQGRYAYITSTIGLLQIFDLKNPASPTLVASTTVGVGNVHVQGRYAYTTDSSFGGRLLVTDVSNPAAPMVVASTTIGANPNGLYVQGRYAYTVANDNLVIVDLGGAYVSQLETGGIETGTLSVRNSIQAMDASLWGSLAVGTSLNVMGGATFTYASSSFGTTNPIFSIVHSTSTTSFGASTTPIFMALANGNIGMGTSTPFGNLVIQNNYGSTNTNVFQVSSSTSATGATQSTLLSLSNAGQLTVSNGVNISSGCFSVAGTCIGYVKRLVGTYSSSTPGSNVSISKSVAGITFSNSGAVTVPASTTEMIVEIWGGGGGGGGAGSAAGGAGSTGGSGGTSCFSTNSTPCSSPLMQATGGAGGVGGDTSSAYNTVGGAAGAGSAGFINLTGQAGGLGGIGDATAGGRGGSGGSAPRGGGGARTGLGANGGTGSSFGGGGAGGGGNNANTDGGGGGGGAGYSQWIVTDPSTTYYYTLGAGGTAGAAGGAEFAGGAGGSGGVIITVYATSSPTAAGNDYAEMFPVSHPAINAADIVAVDMQTPVSMKLAEKGDMLAGVIATQPGQLLGDISATGMRPVALMGRVPTKVNMEGGPIKIGDRIALSSVPGVGKKAGIFDDSVGIAIDNYATSSVETVGSVMVFLNLQDGVNVNAIAFTLLGADTVASIASSSATSTNPSDPIDFVGGMMHAFTSRLASITAGNVITVTSSSTDATTTSTMTTEQSLASSFMQGIFGKMTEWFASATNGIGKLFAKEVKTEKLCVGETCVTEAQLKVLLQTAGAAAAPETPADEPVDAGTTTPAIDTSTGSSTEQTTPAQESNTPTEIPVEESATPPAPSAEEPPAPSNEGITSDGLTDF